MNLNDIMTLTVTIIVGGLIVFGIINDSVSKRPKTGKN